MWKGQARWIGIANSTHLGADLLFFADISDTVLYVDGVWLITNQSCI